MHSWNSSYPTRDSQTENQRSKNNILCIRTRKAFRESNFILAQSKTTKSNQKRQKKVYTNKGNYLIGRDNACKYIFTSLGTPNSIKISLDIKNPINIKQAHWVTLLTNFHQMRSIKNQQISNLKLILNKWT